MLKLRPKLVLKLLKRKKNKDEDNTMDEKQDGDVLPPSPASQNDRNKNNGKNY